ncbi:MAG TPA: M23 family metallopeptidase [Gemmatimonadales bacterium]|nr:M23 family metallopeptidase [Gemmatimonadales bacterium]
MRSCPGSLLSVCLAVLAGRAAAAQSPEAPRADRMRVEIRPATASRGSVVWLVARLGGWPDTSVTLDGSSSGEPLHFERLKDGRFRSLLGIPLEGDDSLLVALRLSTGAFTDSVVVRLAVRQPTLVHERLTVAPRFAQPDSVSRARIEGELAQSRNVSRQAHDTPRLWSGAFRRPRPTRITSGFGSGREYNGTVTNRHLGTDFAGKVGAPVRAAGRAVVALVADFYLAGHAVYLDHGGGLVTGYFHLSRADVATGDTVSAGQVIGGVGRSGRVTGPHLHWIARYGTITVDPMSLFTLGALER